MEHNVMAQEKNIQEEINSLSNRISRSTVAVVDAITQRGGFKGEELSTIGQLRDQCVQVIQLVEQLQQEQALSK
jgi:phage host-nuclease inhibitor protein Gam